MDEFLDSQGLWRKHIPRDSSCLFRAVSEQIHHCQTYHLEVRQECVQYLTEKKVLFQGFVEGSYDEYLNNLRNSKVSAGLVEMSAMSLLYRRDFLVFQEAGQPPSLFTKNSFEQKIMLCYSQANHYDLVYWKEQLDCFAYCQALVYGLLYKRVFSFGEDVHYAVEKMLYDKAYSKKKKSLAIPYFRTSEERKEKCRIKEIDEENNDGDASSEIREMLAQGCPPFPYKVAKALDSGIYRNVEYDRWNQARREQERADQLVVPEFAPGVKCLVRLMENQIYHAHIQEMSPDQGPVTVFIEELGEKKIIPFEHLQPLAIPVYKALAMQGFSCKKSLRFLDGCLKSSPLVSFSTIVSEGFRSSKRYLKKKSKDFPFLLPVTEKQQAICWSSNASGQNGSLHSSPRKNKMSTRFHSEKVKMITSGSDEKTPNKGQPPETHPENAAFNPVSMIQQPVKSQATTNLGFPSSSWVPQQANGLGRGSTPLSTTPAVQSLFPSSPLTFPFVPYAFVGPVIGNSTSTTTTTAGEFGMESPLLNPGVTVDQFGNPYFYTIGTCEVPYMVPTADPSVRSTLNACMGAGEQLQGSTNTMAAGVTPQAGAFWTYNGSFTYLTTPIQGSGQGTDTIDWAIAEEVSPGFQHVPSGVPLLFFVSPPPAPGSMTTPLSTGIMPPSGPYLPAVSSI